MKNSVVSTTNTLYKIKEEFPDISIGKVIYYIEGLASDKETNIRNISDDEFLRLINIVYESLKSIKEEQK